MKIEKDTAQLKQKHGVLIYVHPTEREEVGFVRVDVEEGHFQEFYDLKSTFLYYIVEGSGTFYLDGEENPVRGGDVIIAPPMTKIY